MDFPDIYTERHTLYLGILLGLTILAQQNRIIIMNKSQLRQHLFRVAEAEKSRRKFEMVENIKITVLVVGVIFAICFLILYRRPYTPSYEDYQNQQVMEAIDDLPY